MAVIFMAVLTLFVAACANTNPAAYHVTLETIRVQLPSGAADVDVYWPNYTTKAPLVIVAHGFSRDRKNMSGWGQHLASEGFVAIVPDLPALADNIHNGRFISELRAHLLGDESLNKRIDQTKVGLVGFSAGGLSSLLSAANSPDLAVWIGLDPVDRNSLGVKAAAMLKARAVILTAEPSTCNAYGNALDIVSALPRPEHFSINGAVHVDAEWPTSWLAELFCGRSTAKNRSEFQERATKALKETFALPADQKTKHPVITEH